MHTFDNMGLANQVAVPPQFLFRHIEQELKDIFVQPHWISEVTSNRDGLSATFDSVGTLVIQVFIAASNSNWRHALRMGTALSLVMLHTVSFSLHDHIAQKTAKNSHSKMIVFILTH